MTFRAATASRTIAVLTQALGLRALRTWKPIEDPLLAVLKPELNDYWRRKFSQSSLDLATVTDATCDFFEAKFTTASTFKFCTHDANDGARLAIHVFFTSVVNGILLHKVAHIEGFGTLAYEGHPDKLAFNPDEPIVRALKLVEMRRKKILPERRAGQGYELPPLPGEADPSADELLRIGLEMLHGDMARALKLSQNRKVS
jgi:hypothetical protein